ncbi:SDR family oxidoreductase [Corallincola platygyrae]|uniref:SDR family oxidoreductase n=1 Tax=Corallincola platygyrae TaxID=1193278 RepID=A0ABW4XQM3_9GAMM
MVKVLIAGCGDVGTQLGVLLTQAGHQVTGLRRSLPKEPTFAYQAIDLSQDNSVAQLTGQFDYLVYLPTPDQHDEAGYRRVFVDGLKRLWQHLKTQPKLFYVSSTSVYGQQDGEWVDESSATEPKRFSGKVLLEGEQFAQQQSGTVVRFSGIYGPGRGRLLQKAQQLTEVQSTPPSYTNRIHRDDCARLLAFLIDQHLSGTSLQQIYLGSDDDPAPQHEVMSFLAELQHSPRPQLVSGPADSRQNKRCSNKRIKALGFRFEYPTYKLGYPALISHSSD